MSKPVKVKKTTRGWVIEATEGFAAETKRGNHVTVEAIYVEGSRRGAWLYYAGLDDEDRDGFKVSSDPDFLDGLASALRRLAKSLRQP